MIEITDRKAIAKEYLKGWFWVDLISIIPFDRIVHLFLQNAPSSGNRVNSLIRVMKIGKIYKLIRLIRIIKILKVIKQKTKIDANLTSKVKIEGGSERLMFVSLIFIFACHLFACFWIILGQSEYLSNNGSWFNQEIRDSSDFSKYIIALYFTVTSMTTVGYGDMSGATEMEHVFCMLLMCIGVIVFTYVSGALSSIIGSMDDQNAEL